MKILPENKRYVCCKCGNVIEKEMFLTKICEYWVTNSNGRMAMESTSVLRTGEKLEVVKVICRKCGADADIVDC